MKYLNVFDDKSALDSSVASINHGDGAYIFGVTTSKGIQDVTIYDQRHPGSNCLKLNPVNMSPVKLDGSSTKQQPEVGDILYSTSDGKLTLDAQTNSVDNTPIAICVIERVREIFREGEYSYGTGSTLTARFVSLNYMNYDTPTTGSNNTQYMYFGNKGVTVGNVKGNDIVVKSYAGGKWNTQQCLSKVTNQDVICDGVTNAEGIGYCAPVCCCVAYSTFGTKPGDWYLPTVAELYQIYENKTLIDEKRKAIKGSGFYNDTYWSSYEVSNESEVCVDLGTGACNSGSKHFEFIYTLAFLAVEFPDNPLD